MAGLYDAGWRQGTIVKARLDVSSAVMTGGVVQHQREQHGLWLVATQDCDLARLDEENNEPRIELRPVFVDDPPEDWGIRSARLLITDAPPRYLVSASPRLHVSPAVLTAVRSGGAEMAAPGDERRPAIKTWLGLRYDRPAVPDHFMELAQAICKGVGRRLRREVSMRVRDVLMQFDDTFSPPRYSLFAVLAEASDERVIREWLADIASSVPAELGVADELEAAPASGISLHLIETSYAADVTQLTWSTRPPSGAT